MVRMVVHRHARVREMVGEIDGYRPLHMELVISVVKGGKRAVNRAVRERLIER